MIRLIYQSRAAAMLDEKGMDDITRKAVVFNAAHDISGLLAWHKGNIVQALEGPRESVDLLFARIRRDPRHRDIAEVINETITKRGFADWSMQFWNMDRASEAPASPATSRSGFFKSTPDHIKLVFAALRAGAIQLDEL